MKKTIFIALSAVVLLAAFLLLGPAFPLRAQSDSGVAAKLEKVLGNQRAIMDSLNAMKTDLKKIRIRVSSG